MFFFLLYLVILTVTMWCIEKIFQLQDEDKRLDELAPIEYIPDINDVHHSCLFNIVEIKISMWKGVRY